MTLTRPDFARPDFLGPATMATAAGIPPTPTVFTALPPVARRPGTAPHCGGPA